MAADFLDSELRLPLKYVLVLTYYSSVKRYDVNCMAFGRYTKRNGYDTEFGHNYSIMKDESQYLIPRSRK